MSRKIFIIGIAAVVLHVFFLMLSFDANILASLGHFIDPIGFERAIMLLQFLPLILVIATSRLSRSRILLFVTFAICISTLFVIDDFNTGFYGAVIEQNSSTMPRMRASAHLMAYNDTGKLAVLDFHGQYFLEFIMVHFLSEISSLSYVFTYFFIIRVLFIILWSVLFVWGSSAIEGSGRTIWLFLFASAILLSNQSYNHEISFGPVLLLAFYLIFRREYSRKSAIAISLVVIATMLASFRETLLLGLLSLIALFMTLWPRRRTTIQSSLSRPRRALTFMIAILATARIFIWTSAAYAGTYLNYLSQLVDSAVSLLLEGKGIPGPILNTLETVQNPIDKAISQLAVSFAVGFLVILAISLAFFAARRNLDHFSLAISLAFIIMLSIPLAAYGVMKTTGAGPLRDFGSATTLVRSLTPLAVFVVLPSLPKLTRSRFRFGRWFSMLMVICLSLTMVFSPFLFLRQESRSAYDVSRVSGDMSEYTMLGNHLFLFVTSHISNESEMRILSPASGFLQHYDLLPLEYRTNRSIDVGPMNIALEGRIYDDAFFTVSTSAGDSSKIFLNES